MAQSRRERLAYVPRLFWNAEEAAIRLGVSPATFHEMRKHPLYRNDSERPGAGRIKSLPLWSEALLQHIVFARSKTPQGDRQFTDDEAYEFWIDSQESERINILRKAGHA